MPLNPNQQLFEYRIVRILGRGAFGTVYLAHDTFLDRPVAIKELTITAQTDEVAFNRFIQEARATGNLNHPHIVTAYALKVVEPEVYLVMEYLSKGSLRTLLEKRGLLPVEEAVRIAADVCEGLAAAHARGIIHRDVKPENVLLTEDGRAKISDFGIARVPQAMGGYTMTKTGFQPGTLPYMSPEQVRGQRVDERSDVYGMGVVLYEMLTGRHYVDVEALGQQAREIAGSNVMLFQARLYELLAEAVCEREPTGICKVRPEVPEWVGGVVAAALAKRVEERPTAEELARALRRGEAVRVDRVMYPDAVDVELAEEHVKRGLTYVQQAHWEDAIREWQAALHINPNCIEAHLKLGAAYWLQGRWEDAIREYQAALRINPNLVEAHNRLGGVYYSQGRYEDAIREHRAALCINPSLAEAHTGLGLAYYQQVRLDEAIREYQTALRINPNLAEAHLYLGLAYADQVRLDEAIREYQAALCINPNLAKAHLYLGLAYANQGRLDEAIHKYQAVLRIAPDDTKAHYLLGLAYADQGHLDEAIREFQTVLHIDPNLAMAHYHLGLAYADQGCLDEAIREYQAALCINPNCAEAHAGLGAAYAEQERSDEAIHEWQIAVQLGFEPAQELLAAIKQARMFRK